VRDLRQATALAQEYAPEHLSLVVEEPEALLPSLRSCGAIFVGAAAAAALGDYVAGPNHVLPTAGEARVRSGLSVDSVSRSFSIQRIDEATLQALGPAAVTLARAEGLEGHARSVELRLKATRDRQPGAP